MKVLIDARLYGLEHAGPGRYVLNLINELKKQGNKETRNSFVILLRKKYFDALDLPKNWTKVEADFNHYSFAEQIKLPFIIHKAKPDLVHFPFFNVPLLYFGRFITTIHDLTMHYSKGRDATTRDFPSYLLWRLGYHFSFAKAVYGSQRIIAPSNAVKDEIIKYYSIDESKIKVIYEGIDDNIYASSTKTSILSKYKINSEYFIYSGSVYPHKNVPKIVEAINKLNDNKSKEISPQSKVLLVITSSRNVFMDRLLKIVKDLDAEKYVKYIGFVPDSHLGQLFRNSKGFVYPTLSEGFGLPGLEAMKCGSLALVSNINVLREIYEDKALYFDPNDTESIVEVMTIVLNLTNRDRSKIIEKGQKFIQKYSWSKMAKETLRVYTS